MKTTIAIPIAACAVQLASPCSTRTGAGVEYLMSAPAAQNAGSVTANAATIEEFKLTDQEIARFHQLNLNPPTLGSEVFEVFRARLAKS